MIIDTGHRRWVVGTALLALAAVGGYFALDWHTPGGLTGGSTVGLWYGVAGSLLMIYAGLLAAHRKLARWPLLPRRAWMLKGHIWLGLLSFVVILCHSGFRWGGPLERLLWVVFGAVLVTGIVGLALQHLLPRLLTLRLAEETPYEQMPYVCATMARRAEQLIEAVGGASGGPGDSLAGTTLTWDARHQFRVYFEKEIQPFLAGPSHRPSALRDPARAAQAFERLRTMPGLADDVDRLRELEELCDRRREIAQQERLHHWLHVWLLLHIPLSVALLVLGIAHAVMSLYY